MTESEVFAWMSEALEQKYRLGERLRTIWETRRMQEQINEQLQKT